MRYFNKVCAGIDWFNEKAAKVSAWAIVVLILTIVYEVISRYMFNSPTIWSYEMSYFLSSFLIMMAMAYTLQTKNHVNIDIIYNKLSRKMQLILSIIFTLLFFFPMWFLIVKQMIPNTIKSFTIGERSSYGSWLPLIWPFKAWILLGLIMLLLQGFIEFLRDIIRLFKGDDKV
ncbi:TRAP transporter small permease subunit [Alkalihalobacillus sp. AL-G]|uniref:TRAP transporter small permease subunit n=1 Tax=Alkalihalobacillus sp. AL-G TaxID=2926399 RepID=UPI00272D214D|nr:TRAP transporter small permease subunit [Alkalihalobacillus sp. AL-G]WLD93823.1 TRAP transporter small permease subunit [Alkalihalobacillus sp. AL-G]